MNLGSLLLEPKPNALEIINDTNGIQPTQLNCVVVEIYNKKNEREGEISGRTRQRREKEEIQHSLVLLLHSIPSITEFGTNRSLGMP